MKSDQGRVKRRTYDGSRRKAEAEERHASALEAARQLFQERGYAAASVEAIADRSRVSEATIYKTYGGKPGLLRTLCERALAGDQPEPAEQRSDARRSAAHDARTLLGLWGDFLAEISPRVSPLLLLLRDAAGHDVEVAELAAELDAHRLRRMADNARALVEYPEVRADVDHARDVLWFCTSPDVYDLLVLRRRWSIEAYRDFLTTVMRAELDGQTVTGLGDAEGAELMAGKTYRTRTGRTLKEADLDQEAAEVETVTYDVEALKGRRRGRPPIGSGPAEVVPVRIDPELRAAMEARAEQDHTNTSEIIREALRRYLHVA